jgi:hypothetical protein
MSGMVWLGGGPETASSCQPSEVLFKPACERVGFAAAAAGVPRGLVNLCKFSGRVGVDNM